MLGRWEEIGTELFKLKDRSNKMYCLGPVSVFVLHGSMQQLFVVCLNLHAHGLSATEPVNTCSIVHIYTRNMHGVRVSQHSIYM